MAITFRQLEYMVTIEEKGSFSLAAKELLVSQSAISQCVQKLERDLGVVLFLRLGNGIELTEAGHLFIQQAHLILAFSEKLRKDIDSDKQAFSILRLGTSDTGVLIHKRIHEKFKHLYPNSNLMVIERDPAVVRKMIIQGELDLAFTNLSETHPSIHSEVLTAREMLIVFSRKGAFVTEFLTHNSDVIDHNGEQQYYPRLSLDRCRDFPFVLSGRSTFHKAQLAALSLFIEPRIVMELDTLSSIASMVSSSENVTILPMAFLNLSPERNLLFGFLSSDPLPVFPFSLCYRTDKTLNLMEKNYISLFYEELINLGIIPHFSLNQYIDPTE